MNLDILLKGISWTGLQNDSRSVVPGDIFLAYAGAMNHGCHYIQEAIEKGAVAVLYDAAEIPDIDSHVPVIAMPGLKSRFAEVAQQVYPEAFSRADVIGVTGTNGKTTIAYQLAQAYMHLGKSCAYIGTLGEGHYDALSALNNTTPDLLCLYRLFEGYRQAGIQQVCMEVSSHALAQGRVESVPFKQAIFTNLTHDHLDYHHTLLAYAAAKAKLFAWPSLEWAILNADDVMSARMATQCHQKTQRLYYGIHHGCDVRATSYDMQMHGTCMTVDTKDWGCFTCNVKSIGEFNIYNTLAVISSLLASGYTPQTLIPLLSVLQPAPGRMEVICQFPTVIVDYAHTPDALEKALITLKQLKKNCLKVLFGCGGDRDRLKRPVMGKVASQHADEVILTSDNPRTEDPMVILDEIKQGISSMKPVISIVDRREAIHHVLSEASPDDLILIAGKGHENYQQLGLKKIPFSDQAEVLSWLKK